MNERPVLDPRVAGRVLLSVLVMLVVGVAAGLVWAWLAHPARWEVRSNGIVLTEQASEHQFAVVVLFAAIGAVVSFVWGAAAAWRLRDLGWVMTPVVVLATALAAFVAWRVGIIAGPPDPRSVAGTTVGDTLPSRLHVDGLAPFLTWPVLGLVGLVLATLADQVDDEVDETTSAGPS